MLSHKLDHTNKGYASNIKVLQDRIYDVLLIDKQSCPHITGTIKIPRTGIYKLQCSSDMWFIPCTTFYQPHALPLSFCNFLAEKGGEWWKKLSLLTSKRQS